MTHFEIELQNLKDSLLDMASRAEAAVTGAIDALVQRDDDLAARVKNNDDQIDQLEKAIDEQVIHLLAKAPLASQLRLIVCTAKIARDLERVGDEATTIARRSIELSQEPQLKPYIDIPRMAQMAKSMLGDALSAFVTRDTAKARSVIPRDKEVDLLNKQLYRELASYMIEKPTTITRCLNLMAISKALERIADHAKNVAEDVVYLYEAEDIRHTGGGG
ncbi:MAG TPA: phosphate signaling complex protein PhoU [Verrucomicrobiota bacterium]|nr:phosphate transport system regulatory protein PhoU [Verrucomicrobiales bacterium]HRI14017.1 phosphate signaling complex protein PhoU [Verrucomicrobiota bacterium]